MGATLQTAFTVFSILLFVILATQVAAQVSNQVFRCFMSLFDNHSRVQQKKLNQPSMSE